MRAGVIGYWVSSGLAALLFAVPGAALLNGFPHFVDEMVRLGYPHSFIALLGTSKILGALVILAPGLPRLKEWAYAGMMFDIIGAIASHVAAGDGFNVLIVPIALAATVLMSWALRPEARRLSSRRERFGMADG